MSLDQFTRTIPILLFTSQQTRSIGDSLRAVGYSVFAVRDEAELSQQYSKHPSGLIILDNVEVCRRYHARYQAPILLLTSAEFVEQALDVGALDCLIHPLKKTLFLRRVENLLQTLAWQSSRAAKDHLVTVQALRDSERRYRNLFDNANDAILLIDIETSIIVQVNQQASSMLGYDGVDVLVGMSIDDIEVQQDDSDTAELAPRIPDTTHQYLIAEAEYQHRDGTLVPVETSSSLMIHKGRRVIVCFARNIQTRKLALQAQQEQRILAEALRDSAAAFNSALSLDEVLDAILGNISRVVPCTSANVMMLEDGIVSIVRHSGYVGEGFSAEDLSSTQYELEKTPNLNWAYTQQRPAVITDTHTTPFGWIQNPTSSWIRSSINAPIIVQGETVGFINLDSAEQGSYSIDDGQKIMAFTNHAAVAIYNARLFEHIQQHATELEDRVFERTQQLAKERAQLRAILDSMRDGLIYRDSSGKVQYINKALSYITGYSTKEWLNGTAVRLLDDEQHTAKFANSLDHQGYWEGELELERKDETIFDAQLISAEVRHTDDTALGVVTVLRDISQSKRLEEQKARFITSASHELRTPIANLKTRLYLMRRRPELFQEHIDVAESVVNWMQKLVEDMFDLARFERGVMVLEPELVDLKELIEEVIRFQQPEAERQQIALQMDIQLEACFVHIDPYRFTQIVINLLSNALRYTPEKGEVTIQLSSEDDQIIVRVIDSGVGISSDYLAHLFKPFYRANDDNTGAGLGLSISQEIAQLHGGDITVDSEQGAGTTFTVRLPMATLQASDTL